VTEQTELRAERSDAVEKAARQRRTPKHNAPNWAGKNGHPATAAECGSVLLLSARIQRGRSGQAISRKGDLQIALGGLETAAPC